MKKVIRESQQDKILAMHEDGFTPREMTQELGCSNGSVYATLHKFGLRPNRYKCPSCGQFFNTKEITNVRRITKR